MSATLSAPQSPAPPGPGTSPGSAEVPYNLLVAALQKLGAVVTESLTGGIPGVAEEGHDIRDNPPVSPVSPAAVLCGNLSLTRDAVAAAQGAPLGGSLKGRVSVSMLPNEPKASWLKIQLARAAATLLLGFPRRCFDLAFPVALTLTRECAEHGWERIRFTLGPHNINIPQSPVQLQGSSAGPLAPVRGPGAAGADHTLTGILWREILGTEPFQPVVFSHFVSLAGGGPSGSARGLVKAIGRLKAPLAPRLFQDAAHRAGLEWRPAKGLSPSVLGVPLPPSLVQVKAIEWAHEDDRDLHFDLSVVAAGVTLVRLHGRIDAILSQLPNPLVPLPSKDKARVN